jgi:hypothetical protein
MLCFWTLGQNVNHFNYDTLKYRYLTFGDLDSMDISSKRFSTSFMFSDLNQEAYLINPAFLFAPGNTVYKNFNSEVPQIQFTALPHIGLGYVMGAQGTQKLNFDYEQAFKHGFLINCSVDNFKTNGFFRNSQSVLNRYNFSLARNARRHSFQFFVFATKDQRNWSGGLKDDSLIEVFAPELIPIGKENAQSTLKNIYAGFNNKFAIVQDSLMSFGIATSHSYSRLKRFYIEEDSISSLYANVFIDSTNTFDSLVQHNIRNSSGLYFKRKKLDFEAGVQSDYWSYQAFQFKNDTLEVGLYSKFDLTIKKFHIYQKGNFNLLGASSGIDNLTGFQMSFGSLNFQFSHKFSNQLPSVFQRYFYSNNVVYKTVNPQKQLYQNYNFTVGKNIGKQHIKLDYTFGQFKQVYQFDGNQQIWRNDLTTSEGLFQQIALNSNLNWRAFHSNLTYRFTAMDESKRFVPSHVFDSRFYLKGGIFKAKKLKALLGLELMVASSYKRLNFNPQMTIFDIEQSITNLNAKGFMNAGVFSAFEVETFRLFIRMDNLAYFWQDKKIELLSGYAFPSPQIKVGITWDFWN